MTVYVSGTEAYKVAKFLDYNGYIPGSFYDVEATVDGYVIVIIDDDTLERTYYASSSCPTYR